MSRDKNLRVIELITPLYIYTEDGTRIPKRFAHTEARIGDLIYGRTLNNVIPKEDGLL